ncbi:MAG: T9SS type A sorting domain-containing protein [Saprospiraceae bacterium]|nr:T9SS type A sorting domain-containing protein [Saprospiraceae bacterium]
MKKVTLSSLLALLPLTLLLSQVNEFNVLALPKLVENNVKKIWTGDLDQYGHLIFSVTEGNNPIGLWEYVEQGDEDSLVQLLDIPSIVAVNAYQSQYSDMHRIIYFLHWQLGTTKTYLAKYTDQLRYLLQFDKMMFGVEVSDVLNYGDVVVYGNKTTGEMYDNNGVLTGFTRHGIIHGLLNNPDSTDYRAWTKEVGMIPGAQFCAIYQYQDKGKIIGGFGPADGEGYATKLLCADGTSAMLDELPQPEDVEYTWMGIVPYVGFGNTGTTRFMAAGWVYENGDADYQLLIWNEDLTDYSVYQSFGPEFPGLFKIGIHVQDELGNDALALGGDNIDLEYLGYPEDYSGIIFLNSAGWKPLEEILGYTFLNNNNGIPDVRVLEYDSENGNMWVAGKDIKGKDPSGDEILAGFIVNIQEMEGNLFPLTTNADEVENLIQDYNFNLYPNPSSGLLTISANEPIGQINVFDVSGRYVKSIVPAAATSKMELDIQDLPNGSYLFQIHMNQGVIAKLVQKLDVRP